MSRTVLPDELAAFLERQLELLDLERESEQREAALLLSKCSLGFLQRQGLALLGLGVAATSTGIGGRVLVELERPLAYHQDVTFPPHSFRTGDICRVEEYKTTRTAKKGKGAKETEETKGFDGVVFRTGETKIVIAIGKSDASDDDVDLPERCTLLKLANDATWERLVKTVKTLQTSLLGDSGTSISGTSPLISVLLGLSEPTFDDAGKDEPVWLDANLNDSQREAARFVLDQAREVGLIHGPPGTGKTQTLCEIIRQLVQRGQRVLVCGASNLAVDNLVERLSLHQVQLSRIGHPARILESLHGVTLDSQMAHSSACEVVADIKKEMNGIVTELSKGKIRGKDRKAKWNEHKELRKELRKREGGVVTSVLSQAKVVLATCHGAGGRQLHGMTFDVVVIDEAAQALEAACWIPILKGRKLILAGDPLQLPPTVKSTASAAKRAAKDSPLPPSASLSVTLFERLLQTLGPRLKRLLTTQYRMNERIMRFASNEMYEGKLIAADSVKERTLQDLSDEKDDILLEPIVFYDTAGAAMYERSDSEESLSADSKSNENEATLVVRHIRELVGLGIDPASICCISPYSAQVALLTSLIRPEYPAVQVGTVDGFQGREADVICLSLVRSNDKKEVGFLADSRRLNVAMTRPRRQLVIVGDSETVSAGTAFLKRWMAFLEENADVHPVGMLDM